MSAGSSRRRRPSEAINRRLWNRQSREYDRRHRGSLARAGGLSWGLWRIPERVLGLLGKVAHRDVLELGCGAARWSLGLARRGARPVGIDLSEAQLETARRLQRRAGIFFPLIHGTVESLPFHSASFDIAFSDWGALTFADPLRSIPEAARALRPGGRLVFATASPFRSVAQLRRGDRLTRRLIYPYFGLHRVDYPGEVNYQLPYGRWVELFSKSGFEIERLVELPTPRATQTTYLSQADQEWARSWPAESIWAVRRSGRSLPQAARAGERSPSAAGSSPRGRATRGAR